jgi:hypothetical protein
MVCVLSKAALTRHGKLIWGSRRLETGESVLLRRMQNANEHMSIRCTVPLHTSPHVFVPSVIAPVSPPSSHAFQTISVGQNSVAPRSLPHQPQSSALNESVGGLTGDVLKRSGGSSTEMLLLNSEIVHLRQRLQMEVLSNQELEEVMHWFRC